MSPGFNCKAVMTKALLLGFVLCALSVSPNDGRRYADRRSAVGAAKTLTITVKAPQQQPTGTTINVSTVAHLRSAVANLQSGGTVVLAPGTYNLTSPLNFPQNRTNLGIRGAGNRTT